MKFRNRTLILGVLVGIFIGVCSLYIYIKNRQYLFEIPQKAYTYDLLQFVDLTQDNIFAKLNRMYQRNNEVINDFIQLQNKYGVNLNINNFRLPFKMTILREDEQTLASMNSLIINSGTYEFVLLMPENAKLSFWLSMIPIVEEKEILFTVAVNGKVVFNEDLASSRFKSWRNYSIDLSSYSTERCRLSFSIRQISKKLFPTRGNVLLLGNPVVFSADTKVFSNKNVILFVVDALRADRLGCYGYERNTSPEIDTFAANSFKFEHAYSQANNTAPSVSSFISSLYPSAALRFLEETNSKTLVWQRMDENIYTMIDAFKQNGYKTAFFTTNMVLQYSTPFDIYFLVKEDTKRDTRRYYAGIKSLLPVALDFVDRYKNEKFFLYVHIMDLHAPYASPEPYLKYFLPADNNSKYDNLNDFVELFIQRPHSYEELMYLNGFYNGTILYTSKKFKELIDWLQDKGIYQDTIIIFTADHGEQIEEHGYFGHGGHLFEEEIHVPLIIKPTKKVLVDLRPCSISENVELTDIFPTLIEMLGLKISSRYELWGTSLVSLMERRNDAYRKEFIFSQNQWTNLRKMIRKGRYKYILSNLKFDAIFSDKEMPFWNNPSCKEEIYDLSTDIFERHNLIEKFKDSQLLSEFRQIISDIAIKIRDFNMLKPEVDYLDLERPEKQEEIEKLKSLGYIN